MLRHCASSSATRDITDLLDLAVRVGAQRGTRDRAVTAGGLPPALPGHRRRMFFFFSNRLGCAGSLLLSLVVTAILLYVLNR
ncbi:hypothetical protein GCM10009606_31040 [Nocardioides aquiterrae]|uniref:Uncharacterized protein n=1 Tax=Nocardioides aquiterrae TaxID=203799 RepID=A0ABN1UGY1_9ACTN